MNSPLPALNALLNSISLVLLLIGFQQIKRHNAAAHKRIMLAAVAASALFLTSYLIYHAQAGSVPYPHHDWTRPLYFAILIPHIILATVMVPFILLALWRAWQQQFDRHKHIVHWIWPIWVFVSLSGVAIFAMLYLR